MQCNQCGQSFDSTRKTALFCSTKCRQKANYKLSVGKIASESSKELSVGIAKVSVVDNRPLIGARFDGIRRILDHYRPEEITKELLDEIDPSVIHRFIPDWMRNGITVEL